jgi:hypothetical protein
MEQRPRRPNPFTSYEGCFLSRTVGAVFFVIGLVAGAYIGFFLGEMEGAPFGREDGSRFGAALGAVALWMVPWRRWLVRKIKERNDATDDGVSPS